MCSFDGSIQLSISNCIDIVLLIYYVSQYNVLMYVSPGFYLGFIFWGGEDELWKRMKRLSL